MTPLPASTNLVSTAPAFDLFGFFGLPPLPLAPPVPSVAVALPPLPAPPEPPPPALTAEQKKFTLAHLKWARAIARGVREDYGFQENSQEELELEQTAYLVVCEYAARFNPERVPAGGCPGGQFRGWVAIEVRSRCRRVAVQIRAGGTVRTTNNKQVKKMKVGGIPNRCPSCTAASRPWWEDADPSDALSAESASPPDALAS